jgi:hypothetical protein
VPARPGQLVGQGDVILLLARRTTALFANIDVRRTNAEHLLTTPFIQTNWTLGLNAKGQPHPRSQEGALA